MIEISAPLPVYDVSAPNFTWNGSPEPPEVFDTKQLQSIDGAGPDEEFSAYLTDGTEEEQQLAQVVSGGTLKLSYDQSDERLVATVTYATVRNLNPDEMEQLREYTFGQLLDGIGESFQQAYARRRERLWIAFEDIDYDAFRFTADDPDDPL